MLRVFVVAASLAAAGPALAEEFGRITAEYGGEAREWFTISLTHDGQTDASATFGSAGMTTDLHIQGHPRAAFTTNDVVSIDAFYMGEFAPGKAPVSVEVIHLPEGMNGPIWTSEGAPTPATIGIDEIELAGPGEIGRVAGSFAAELCRKASIMAEPDTGDCKTIVGRFETRLLME